jgi:hypothetical protein
MRVLWLIAFLGSSLPLAVAADSTNRRHASPTPDTNDADTKAEYLESIPYRPCPSTVRMPNGQVVCLGLAQEPYKRRYDPYE